MATTITLRNIPEAVYKRLKEAAQAHRRSLNSEVLACLERALMPDRITPVDRMARARKLRARFKRPADPKDIAKAIDRGRT